MMQFQENEIFFDTQERFTYVWKDNDLMLVASLGAPPGTLVGGIDAEELAKGHVDFDKSNNRNKEPITYSSWSVSTPAESNRGNGSADVEIRWTWDSVASDGLELPLTSQIDGFAVQVFDKPNLPVSFPAMDSPEFVSTAVMYVKTKGSYAITHNCVETNHVAFKITPYRSVGVIDGTPSRVIFGTAKTSTSIKPSNELTYDNISVAEMNQTVRGVLEDGAVQPHEKRYVLEPWLARISDVAGTNSEYLVTLDKISKASPHNADETTLLANASQALTSARNAIYWALNTIYPEANPKDLTQSTGLSSYLLMGTATRDAQNNLVPNDFPNRKKTHIIPNREVFQANFTNYLQALGEVEMTLQVIGMSLSDDALSKIPLLADYVLTREELQKEDRYYKDESDRSDSLQKRTQGLLAFTAPSTAKTALDNNRINTYGFPIDLATETIGETANLQLAAAIVASRTMDSTVKGFKFQNNSAVIAYLVAVSNWDKALEDHKAAFEDMLQSLRTAQLTWDTLENPVLVAIKTALSDYNLDRAERKTIKQEYTTFKRADSSFKSRANKLSVVAGNTLYDAYVAAMTALTTEMEIERDAKDAKGVFIAKTDSTKTTNLLQETYYAVFSTISEMLQLFNKFKDLVIAKSALETHLVTIEDAEKEKAREISVEMDEKYSSSSTAITASPAFDVLTFSEMDTASGTVDLTATWGAIPTTVDGIIIGYRARINQGNITTPSASALLRLKSSYRSYTLGSDMTSGEFDDLRPTRFYTLFACYYRVVSRKTYNAAIGTKVREPKSKNYLLLGPVSRSHANGSLVQPAPKLVLDLDLKTPDGSVITPAQLKEVVFDFDGKDSTSSAAITAKADFTGITYKNHDKKSNTVDATLSWTKSGSGIVEGVAFITIRDENEDGIIPTYTAKQLLTEFGKGLDFVKDGTLSVDVGGLSPTASRTAYAFYYRTITKTAAMAIPEVDRIYVGQKFWRCGPVTRSHADESLSRFSENAVLRADLETSTGVLIPTIDLIKTVTDYNTRNNQNTNAITGTLSNITVDFYNAQLDDDKELEIAMEVKWSSTTANASIDGYIVYCERISKTQPSSTMATLPTINQIEMRKKQRVFVKATERVAVLEVSKSAQYNVIILPVRVLDPIYKEHAKASPAPTWLSRFDVFEGHAIIYKTGYAWAFTQNKLVENQKFVQATVPPLPLDGDYWLHETTCVTSKYSSSRGWEAVTSSTALNKHRQSIADKTTWMIPRPTEPPNVEGYYWKNTNSKALSGVRPKDIVYWNASDGLWVSEKEPPRHKTGTHTLASQITWTPIDGAIAITTNNSKKYLFAAQNGRWRKVAEFSAGEFGLDKSTAASTAKRFLDTDDYVYYTRATTSSVWRERDLFTRTTFKASTVVALAKG